MEDIISQIIKIDQQAVEKINELNETTQQHIREFEANIEETNRVLEQKVELRINTFTKVEQEYIESQKLEMDKELQDKIKKLNDAYDYKHEEIERKIFKKITSLSV